MLSVNTNLAAGGIQNKLINTQSSLSQSFERLSSGLRVNGARDDAAGLSISTRMEAEARGLAAARRNALDGISLVQTADGALNEVVNGLQRIRELGIQAINGTNNESDLKAIQGEINQIMSEFDRINEATQFNGENIFSQSNYAAAADNSSVRDVLTGLKSSWLRQAEDRIEEYYGLTGDGRNIDITLGTIDGVGNVLGRANGSLIDLDLDDYTQVVMPDGTSSTNSTAVDSLVAHELTHTMQFINFSNVSTANTPHWFLEGTAEFIGGADARVAADIANGAHADADALVDAAALLNDFSAATSADYSRGYLAVRYMHDAIKQAGGTGIRQIMEDLRDNGSTLDQAITNASSGAFADLNGFITSFRTTPGEGDVFVNGLDLSNIDSGAIGGFDADGGEVLSADDVFDNSSTLGQDPLRSLNAKFANSVDPTKKQGGKLTRLHIGSGNESLEFYLGSFGKDAMGLANIDVTKDGSMAVSYVDDAIAYVNGFRSELGAIQNRLDSTVNTLSIQEESAMTSKSRIVDADFAAETAQLTQSQIIQQAATNILAQANASPQIALSLLR